MTSCTPGARTAIRGEPPASTIEPRCPGRLGAPCAAFDTVFDNLTGVVVLDGGSHDFTRQPSGPVRSGTYTLRQQIIDGRLRYGDVTSRPTSVRLFFEKAEWKQVETGDPLRLKFTGECDPGIPCTAEVAFAPQSDHTLVTATLVGTVTIS